MYLICDNIRLFRTFPRQLISEKGLRLTTYTRIKIEKKNKQSDMPEQELFKI